MKTRRNLKIKSVLVGFTAVSLALALGTAAACSTSSDDDDDDKVVSAEDTQEIKNGNFEFYEDNDGLYPISTPDNWDFSYSGTQSDAMSGIIKTNKAGWDYVTDVTLPETLENNDDLDDDDDEKEDYNGALTEDMLFKNSHDAVDQSSYSSSDYIKNPYTHNLKYDVAEDGTCTYTYTYTKDDGTKVTTTDVHTDEDGKVYTDSACKDEIGTSVLMIHNYREDYYRGNEGYYESSTTLTLEANTTCKISVWVKTEELYCDNSKAERAEVTFGKGAYIKVDTAANGSSLDSFTIKNINTEQLNPDGNDNGWVQYTVYVQGCSFASTTVTLTLGLGENGSSGIETVEGYAFFDDITYESYQNLDSLKEENSEFSNIDADNTYYALEDDANKTFRVDKETTKTGDGTENYTEPNNFDDKFFFIDLSSATNSAATFTMTDSNTEGGLTVDDDKYTSASAFSGTSTLGYYSNGADSAKLPTNLSGGITTTADLLTIENITESWSYSQSASVYSTLLTEKLSSAVNLPDVGATANTLVMLSANAAAYETVIYNDETFRIKDGEYKLISFWMKTSDFDGNTAVTVTVYDADDEDNSANFTIDTTTLSTTSFGDNDDIYDGWVRCFIRVENTSEEDGYKTFKIKVNLGRTSFKGTTSTDYFKYYGWLALTNITVLDMDETVYGYTTDLSNSASLAFEKATEVDSEVFDEEQGSKNVITDTLAIPSSYTGVYGNSVSVTPTGSVRSDYDKTNSNEYAGLLNKDNFSNYSDETWYTALSDIFTKNSTSFDWESFAGKYTVQPLLIVNTVQKFSEEEKIYNYGYIGSDTTISSDTYTQISVRVKASYGAVAYVYLVDADTDDNSVMSYEIPEYGFYYDDDGNILKSEYDADATKAEKKANIAYTLREDGLYESTEDGDDKLYANWYNLEKYYDISDEKADYYDKEGNKVAYDNLVQGETYYANSELTKLAPHYLIAGGKENNKIYKYNDGLGEDATYYYMEYVVSDRDTDDESTSLTCDKLVYGVNTDYSHINASDSSPYCFKIDGSDEKYTDNWVTVTFYVHTGSESKNYRLELWSGRRDEQSSYDAADSDSYVLFDYSPRNEETAEDVYSDRLNYYTDAIKADLIENLKDGEELESSDLNIAELEALAKDDYTKIYDYSAAYYTYCLYDSTAFIPFNGETADDDEVGYSYTYSSYSEELTYLMVQDSENLSMTAFIDYSVIDKDIEILGEPTVPETEDDDDDETTETNVWLLVASIVMIVAIFVAMAAMGIKQLIKKRGKNRKHVGRNTYNFTKNKRYVRKYVKANGEAPETTETAETTENGETAETTETVETAEKPATEATETNAEEMTSGATEPEEKTEKADSETATPSPDDSDKKE